MDIISLTREIGLFETVNNFSGLNPDILAVTLDDQMPLPASAGAIAPAADWLLSFGKKRLLFCTPELSLVETLAASSPRPLDCQFVLPFNLDPESRQRLLSNLPKHEKISVSTIQEPAFPDDFYPSNSMIVACGYLTGSRRAMVQSDTYRLLEHYKTFLGAIVFLPVFTTEDVSPYDAWLQVPQGIFTYEWRNDL